MFTGVSCFENKCHHELWRFGLLGHNGREKGFRRRRNGYGGLEKVMKKNATESNTENCREKAQGTATPKVSGLFLPVRQRLGGGGCLLQFLAAIVPISQVPRSPPAVADSSAVAAAAKGDVAKEGRTASQSVAVIWRKHAAIAQAPRTRRRTGANRSFQKNAILPNEPNCPGGQGSDSRSTNVSERGQSGSRWVKPTYSNC